MDQPIWAVFKYDLGIWLATRSEIPEAIKRESLKYANAQASESNAKMSTLISLFVKVSISYDPNTPFHENVGKL